MKHSLLEPVIILLLLTLSLSPLSNVLPSARAVSQSGPTSWSPFGPYSEELLITVHSDFQTMFNSFVAGELDITDWAVQPPDLSNFGNNPDFFLTTPSSQAGIFHIDFNHHKPFLGIAQQTTRTLSPPGLTVLGTTAGCSVGFGRLVVNLKNQEEGNAVILDPLNKVSVVGPVPVPPVKDDPAGGSSTDGAYVLPSPTTCLLAGTYTISATVYSGSANVFVGSGQIVSVDFRVNYNSATVLKPTQAGIEIRKGIAHLLDKPSFPGVSSIGGNADYNDLQAPPGQGLNIGGAPNSKLPQAIRNEDCSAHLWLSSCSPVSAYNLTPDSIGGGSNWWTGAGAAAGANFGYSGIQDLRAACDHMRLAGFQVTGATNPNKDDCLELAEASQGTSAPPSYPHLAATGQLNMYIRNHPPRAAFGQIIADSINLLFGGGKVLYGTSPSPVYFTITQVFDIVFVGSPGLDDWDIYTGGFSLGSTPDHLYGLYHSSFSGGICAGVTTEQPNNYPFYCNPVYDASSNAGQFSTSLPEANSFLANAAATGHRTVMTIPVYTLTEQFVALNGWSFQPGLQSSLVNVLGHGFMAGFWSLLNMRQKPGYTPADAKYVPGDGNPGLIRRGFSQDVHRLSPFHALTVWDFEVLLQVFDSMLAVNPLTGGTGQQVIDWMTTSHSSSFNPVEVSCVGTNCVTGTTTQTWRLRNDIKFHDGTPVRAGDIVYSIIAYRDIPSANLQPNVATVSDAFALNDVTLQVKLQGQSPFYEINIGGLPIIPKHIWEPVCGSPPNPAALCGSPAFDPMDTNGAAPGATGIYIGSGPWACKHLDTGVVGGSCHRNASGILAGQDVTLGGRILLKANDLYMRGPTLLQGSSLQNLGWADKNDDGIVNILDIADAALYFGQANTYWDHPLRGVGDGLVDIGEIAGVAFYFDHGTTKPYLPGQLTGLDPRIDPSKLDLTAFTGPVMYYQGGRRTVSGDMPIKLVSLSGIPGPASFTATLSTISGTLVGSATGTQGSSSSIVLLPFSGVNPGRYRLSISYNSQFILTMIIQA